MLVDTHAHLNFKDFENNLDPVIQRSIKSGVEKIICVSSNVVDARKAIEIARTFSGRVYAAVGLHPQKTDPKNDDPLEKQIDQLKTLACQKEVVAVGECGLDFSPAPPEEKDRSKKEQFFLFQEQIKIALQLNKPLIVHSRKAFTKTVELLSTHKLNGVFHCYSAGKKGVAAVEELGLYFGVDGNLTYDQGMQNVFAQIPLDRILLETDAPFLAPKPHRGQASEPAHVKIIAKQLAEIKNLSFRQITQATTQNAKKIFQI